MTNHISKNQVGGVRFAFSNAIADVQQQKALLAELQSDLAFLQQKIAETSDLAEQERIQIDIYEVSDEIKAIRSR